jgi:hypothetical protein
MLLNTSPYNILILKQIILHNVIEFDDSFSYLAFVLLKSLIYNVVNSGDLFLS